MFDRWLFRLKVFILFFYSIEANLIRLPMKNTSNDLHCSRYSAKLLFAKYFSSSILKNHLSAKLTSFLFFDYTLHELFYRKIIYYVYSFLNAIPGYVILSKFFFFKNISFKQFLQNYWNVESVYSICWMLCITNNFCLYNR